LRIIAGLEESSNGDIYIGDDRVNDVEPKNRDIAMVFQNYALYPHMNVFDNMGFGLKLQKIASAEIDSRVSAAAEILGIGDLLKRRPKELSGGQRQRVAVGRAIVRNPSVFLFDEPLSNLDAKLRVQMRTEIKKLHAKLGTTMIYVTHDQVEAMTMGDRIAVLKDGHLLQADAPLNLYNQPTNQFVASFIGSPSMNFLDVNVNTSNGIQLVNENFKLKYPREEHDGLAEYSGRNVILGVRPEHLELTKSGEGIAVQMEVSELMGSESYLYTLCGESQVVARVQSNYLFKIDETVNFLPQYKNLHFFDPISGIKID
jgi:multiple sugar transport system ATP-binding protein